jgi:hypothetical protein
LHEDETKKREEELVKEHAAQWELHGSMRGDMIAKYFSEKVVQISNNT